jgi:cellulose synthase/poly-beta-1,6-N-acetylglucosamine synthase-like glycosyltransferase
MHVIETILIVLFIAIQVVLAFYLLVPFFFLVAYGLKKLFRAKTPFERQPVLTDKNFEFGIIITAHQETKFVVPLVDSIIKQQYGNFQVYIVADDCDTAAWNFTDKRIKILQPEPALHSKIKSIHYGLSKFERKHDAVIILDADNLIHPSFLQVMNQYFQKGYKVVQADFKPKNTDTHYARMDAIGDMFNFFLEREARMWLNLSAAIWGSGVAIDLDLYKEVQYADFLGGFDKKLQSHLVRRVKRIAFAPAAILYDEKVTSGKSLENQRTRWISSYFKYFDESLKILWAGIKKASINLIYFSMVTLRPPLFLVIGFSMIAAIINIFINPLHFYAWLIILGLFLLSFAAIVVIKGRDIRFLRTFLLLPLFAFRQLLALLKVKKAKKSFLKTEHTELVYIDDLLKKP